MTQIYRIEELCTDEWQLIDQSAQQLTKEQCNHMLRYYLDNGMNPNHLRAVPDVRSQS
jgi:hypothetical protein